MGGSRTRHGRTDRLQRTRRRLGCERGQSFILFIVILVGAMFPILAFVVDLGDAMELKRHLQSSADAAALAAARELPNQANATTFAHSYSGEPGGKNENEDLGTVTTAVSFPNTIPPRVRVTQSAKSRVFFAGWFGFDGFEVSATAVAVRGDPPPSEGQLAIYVHERCGSATENGLRVNGLNATVEGAIHVNGQFTVNGDSFEGKQQVTVYRPTAGSPVEPGLPQGTCRGNPTLFIEDKNDSIYCTACGITPTPTNPSPGQYRPWLTPYHSAQIVRERILGAGNPCTHTYSGDKEFVGTDPPAPPLVIPDGVHCVPSDKEFKISKNVVGRITVIAGKFTIGGTGKLEPYDLDEPVLFYSTSNEEIVLNPSQAYDWVGYIIHRTGGIVINAADVTSPLKGLLESEWVAVNGENFTMEGVFPDPTPGDAEKAPLSLIE